LLEGRPPSREELIEELNAEASNSPVSSGLSEPPELPVPSGQQDHVPELPSRADKLFSAVMDNFIRFLATENEQAWQHEEQHQEQAQQNEEQHQEEMREFLLSLFKESSRREAKTFAEFHAQQKEFMKTITAAIATSIKEAKVLHQSSNQAFIDVIAGQFPLPATPSDEPSSITTTMSATDEDPKTMHAGPSYSHEDKGKWKESSDPPKRLPSTPRENPCLHQTCQAVNWHHPPLMVVNHRRGTPHTGEEEGEVEDTAEAHLDVTLLTMTMNGMTPEGHLKETCLWTTIPRTTTRVMKKIQKVRTKMNESPSRTPLNHIDLCKPPPQVPDKHPRNGMETTSAS
jgi:hypothetical protein